VSVPQPLLRAVSRVVDSIPVLRAALPILSVDRAKEIWPDRWVISPEVFKKQFSWKASDDIDHAIRETHAWYVKTGQLRV
jgi:hypothetical protein